MKSYLCIVSRTDGQGMLGDIRTAALAMHPGLMGYKHVMNKELPYGALMGIYEVSFTVFASHMLKRIKAAVNADIVLIYDPRTKMIGNTPFSDWEKMEQIIKSIKTEPAIDQ